MTFLEKLDPEVAGVLSDIPAELILAIGSNPPVAREMLTQMQAAMKDLLPPTQVTIEERTITGPDGDIPLVIYQPPIDGPRPGLLWIHGGGYIVGTAYDDATCVVIAEQVGCTIVSVDYRLAPEHPFPAGMEDCYAALQWMAANTDELGVDPARIAIGGASAGGGMSAGLALLNRDRGGADVAFQLLLYPMLDDTHETASGYEITYPKVWNRDVSMQAWQMYLGDAYGNDDVSPYAAPARVEELSGLPPAFICVGTMDLFRDEDIDYAKRLMAAGIPTQLEVFPGMFHGGESFAPTAEVSQRMLRGYLGALQRAFA